MPSPRLVAQVAPLLTHPTKHNRPIYAALSHKAHAIRDDEEHHNNRITLDGSSSQDSFEEDIEQDCVLEGNLPIIKHTMKSSFLNKTALL